MHLTLVDLHKRIHLEVKLSNLKQIIYIHIVVTILLCMQTQVGNKWKWGQGESFEDSTNDIDWSSVEKSANIGLVTGLISGATSYGLNKIAYHPEVSITSQRFSQAADDVLIYGDNSVVNNTINGIYDSAREIAELGSMAEAVYTTIYTGLSNAVDVMISKCGPKQVFSY